MPHTVFLLDPALSDVNGADSTFLITNLGLTAGSTAGEALTAAFAYWSGGRNGRKCPANLNNYAWTQTTRSSPANREFVIYPNTFTAQQAIDRVAAISGLIE